MSKNKEIAKILGWTDISSNTGAMFGVPPGQKRTAEQVAFGLGLSIVPEYCTPSDDGLIQMLKYLEQFGKLSLRQSQAAAFDEWVATMIPTGTVKQIIVSGKTINESVAKLVERVAGLDKTPIHTCQQGHWVIHEMSLVYGGPEEEGWWREVGHLMCAIPGNRQVGQDFTQYLQDEDTDRPLSLQSLVAYLATQGYHEDNEFRQTHPKHNSILVSWTTEEPGDIAQPGNYE